MIMSPQSKYWGDVSPCPIWIDAPAVYGYSSCGACRCMHWSRRVGRSYIVWIGVIVTLDSATDLSLCRANCILLLLLTRRVGRQCYYKRVVLKCITACLPCRQRAGRPESLTAGGRPSPAELSASTPCDAARPSHCMHRVRPS